MVVFFGGTQDDQETCLLELVEKREGSTRGCGEDQGPMLQHGPYPRGVEEQFRVGVCTPGAVGDRAENGKSVGGFLHGYAEMIFEGEVAVEVNPEVFCDGSWR